MAVSNPPAFMDQDTYAAQFDRRWLGYDFLEDSTGTSIRTALGGIVSTGDLLVSQNGTPNMTVNVAAGACYIRGTSVSNQGIYRCVASSTTNLAISAAHATLERWDLVVGRIYDNTHDGSGQHVWALEIVTGTPSGSPSEPALPASSFKLARVTVPAADTTITDSQIANSALLLDFRASSAGQKRVLTRDEFTSNSPTFTTTETDLFTASAVTLVAGHLYEIRFGWPKMSSTVAGDLAILRIKTGATIRQEWNVEGSTTARHGGEKSRFIACTSQIGSGSQTFKVTGIRTIGSGTMSIPNDTDARSHIVVIDHGLYP